MTMVYCWKLCLTFCHHLHAASSGVFLPALFNTAVERREPDSVVDVVIPEISLLPPRRWVTFVPAAGVAEALCLVQRLPHLQDHTWRCCTQMAEKWWEDFSKVDHGHQVRTTKLHTSAVKKLSPFMQVIFSRFRIKKKRKNMIHIWLMSVDISIA